MAGGILMSPDYPCTNCNHGNGGCCHICLAFIKWEAKEVKSHE